MIKTLDEKLAALKKDPSSPVFILADAKDADMAYGIVSTGRDAGGRLRSLAEYRDQIRANVAQGLVDVMLMSASTSEILAIDERIFNSSAVTPAVRANDATDVHVIRGSVYPAAPCRPFATATLDHIQAGKCPSTESERSRGVDLGLYSITFNNDPERDLETLQSYKAFRLEAEARGFRHFLEVFAPNVPQNVHRIPPSEIPHFVNDHIVRLLAGVPSSGRPCFLKIPFFGPRYLEELCAYDPSMVVGVLGGSAGTTHDAFALLHDARRYGARVALFGRKINSAEHQPSFIEFLRLIADGHISPSEAVKAYHGRLSQLNIAPIRTLALDLELASASMSYAAPE
jgi:hypothetical protein